MKFVLMISGKTSRSISRAMMAGLERKHQFAVAHYGLHRFRYSDQDCSLKRLLILKMWVPINASSKPTSQVFPRLSNDLDRKVQQQGQFGARRCSKGSVSHGSGPECFFSSFSFARLLILLSALFESILIFLCVPWFLKGIGGVHPFCPEHSSSIVFDVFAHSWLTFKNFLDGFSSGLISPRAPDELSSRASTLKEILFIVVVWSGNGEKSVENVH